jgi:multisubunit Na+/H+ antiporter MnhB subunit
MRQIASFAMVVVLGAILVYTVSSDLLPFGSFPRRELGETAQESIGSDILEEAPEDTGSANVVTSVVWGYRGYDTLGEATVLFTAVVGVLTVLRVVGRHD